jgi:hypothetical protein
MASGDENGLHAAVHVIVTAIRLDEGQVSEVIRDLRNNFSPRDQNVLEERGAAARETGASTMLLDRQSGRSTIETIHEVGLKQFCARFNTWVEQASQP